MFTLNDLRGLIREIPPPRETRHVHWTEWQAQEGDNGIYQTADGWREQPCIYRDCWVIGPRSGRRHYARVKLHPWDLELHKIGTHEFNQMMDHKYSVALLNVADLALRETDTRDIGPRTTRGLVRDAKGAAKLPNGRSKQLW